MHKTAQYRLVFATNNRHKFDEIRHAAGDAVDLLKLEDIGFSGEIPEDHHTLEDNAAQKAYFIYNRFGFNCFADDTGLEIEALHGEPGVFSARYAGEHCTFEDNINKVLSRMDGITNRTARFRTVIALVEQGVLKIFEGAITGRIITERRGQKGFGYDPIFQPDGFDQTFAEMSLGEKNRISHRASAIQGLLEHLVENHPSP